MDSAHIRTAFVDFFSKHNHKAVASASLIPANDPSLLFTNAGMVPFKEYFLGMKIPPQKALTSAQRVLRVGGKHNDLENVGFTARHLTFFEMLGNFSFGAYGREQAMRLAWKFLTEELKLPKDRLWVTVYKDDAITADLWVNNIGIEACRVLQCGAEDNFWSMGDTGPCGPSTEIFYDHGPKVPGGLPGSTESEGDRYVEIWNLVFMEFNRNERGVLSSLPVACIDTGMGLERISAVMQGVTECFQIDTFQKLFAAIERIANQERVECSLSAKKVIADHMRAIVWMMCDQIRPSNEGRGYVLRRLIRRALRFARASGLPIPCLQYLVPTVVDLFASDSALVKSAPIIQEAVLYEEKAFASTLETGLSYFEKLTTQCSGHISGELAFKMYDTYGFPLDLLEDIAKERSLHIDVAGYHACMREQRERSREHKKFTDVQDHSWTPGPKTSFLGYNVTKALGCLTHIWSMSQEPMQVVTQGQEAMLVLDQTPFYAESGGQIGDCGVIYTNTGEFLVSDTQKIADCIVHIGVMKSGEFKLKYEITAEVSNKRWDIACHHSATHLLHAALVKILGEHVVQKGSLVTHDKLRFDFSHTKGLTTAQWVAIEDEVNACIRANTEVESRSMPLEDARASGAKALFTEKYEDEVRVVKMGEVSKELCGGIHVQRTGDLGVFTLTAETAVSQGVRRIEARCGQYAMRAIQHDREVLWALAKEYKTAPELLLDKYKQQHSQQLSQQKRLKELEVLELKTQVASWSKQVRMLAGQKILLNWVDALPKPKMRDAVEYGLKSMPNTVIILLARYEDNTLMCALGVPKEFESHYSALTMIEVIKPLLSAKGGGKKSFASCVGRFTGTKDECLKTVEQALTVLIGKAEG